MLERLSSRAKRAGSGSEVDRLATENAELRTENAELRTAMIEMRTTLATQETRITELEELVERLQGKVATNSRNSSKPPSSDGPETAPRIRRKRGKKRGGQAGHEGTTRAMVPFEQVDEVVDCRPESCSACNALLLGEDRTPVRRQIIDIPPPRVFVTEYRLHRLTCLACGGTTQADMPAGLPESVFGAGLHALAAVLVGRFRQSKRLVVELFEILYSLSLSPASVCAMERRVAAALEAPVEEARTALRNAPVVGKDETGWRHKKSKAWLWLTATDQLAVFTIARRRSSAVVKQILGEAFDGVVCSDRWGAYAHLKHRQLCWAHLLRDFTAMIERHGSPWHGQWLAVCARQVMEIYAEREAGDIDHDEMVRRMEPVRQRTHKRLTWAAKMAPGPKARAMAREILKVEEHLWTFLTNPAIPVTNNLRERLLRYAVIWRKLSYGTDSDAGARFVERILSVTASLKLQQRDVFGYLTTAIEAHFHGQTAPSILPITSDSG